MLQNTVTYLISLNYQNNPVAKVMDKGVCVCVCVHAHSCCCTPPFNWR